MLVALGNWRLCFRNVTLGMCESFFFFNLLWKCVNLWLVSARLYWGSVPSKPTTRMFCLAVGSIRYCALADIFGKGRSPNWNHLHWRPNSQIRPVCWTSERIDTSRHKKTWICVVPKIVHSQMGRVIGGTVSIHFVTIVHSKMGQVISGTVSINFVTIIHSKMGQVISGTVSINFVTIIHSKMGQVTSGTVSINFVEIIHSKMGQVLNVSL